MISCPRRPQDQPGIERTRAPMPKARRARNRRHLFIEFDLASNTLRLHSRFRASFLGYDAAYRTGNHRAPYAPFGVRQLAAAPVGAGLQANESPPPAEARCQA